MATRKLLLPWGRFCWAALLCLAASSPAEAGFLDSLSSGVGSIFGGGDGDSGATGVKRPEDAVVVDVKGVAKRNNTAAAGSEEDAEVAEATDAASAETQAPTEAAAADAADSTAEMKHDVKVEKRKKEDEMKGAKAVKSKKREDEKTKGATGQKESDDGDGDDDDDDDDDKEKDKGKGKDDDEAKAKAKAKDDDDDDDDDNHDDEDDEDEEDEDRRMTTGSEAARELHSHARRKSRKRHEEVVEQGRAANKGKAAVKGESAAMASVNEDAIEEKIGVPAPRDLGLASKTQPAGGQKESKRGRRGHSVKGEGEDTKGTKVEFQMAKEDMARVVDRDSIVQQYGVAEPQQRARQSGGLLVTALGIFPMGMVAGLLLFSWRSRERTHMLLPTEPEEDMFFGTTDSEEDDEALHAHAKYCPME